MPNAQVLTEVVAGMIPERPMDEYTKQWALSGAEWREPVRRAAVLDATFAYARELSESGINWVRVDFIYL